MIKTRDLEITDSLIFGGKTLLVVDGKLHMEDQEILLTDTEGLIPGVPLTVDDGGSVSPLILMDTITLHVNDSTGNDEITSGAEELPYKTLDKALEDSQLYGFYPSVVIVVHGTVSMSASHSMSQSKDVTIRGEYGTSPIIEVGALEDGSSCSMSIQKGTNLYIENIELRHSSSLTVSSSIFTGELNYLSLVGLVFSLDSDKISLLQSFGNLSIKLNSSQIVNGSNPLVDNMGGTMLFISIDASTSISSTAPDKIVTTPVVDGSNVLNLFLSKMS